MNNTVAIHKYDYYSLALHPDIFLFSPHLSKESFLDIINISYKHKHTLTFVFRLEKMN